MVREWEVRWEGELPASPQDVWDAITRTPTATSGDSTTSRGSAAPSAG